MKIEIDLDIQAQPTGDTCGPTCLHALYRHYGRDDVTLARLISQIRRLHNGGTLAEILAVDALRRGFDATIYTFHMQMFDPTWFADDGEIHNPGDVSDRLAKQLRVRRGDRRLRASTRAFREFLALGGRLRLSDLTTGLISRYLAEGSPIIAGLSSTFLYRSARELDDSEEDDIRGEPQGHFVMLVGYDSVAREVLIADPLDPNPPFHTAKYRLGIDRLLNAILLGILTYDANLLIICPKRRRARGAGRARRAAPPARGAARAPKRKGAGGTR